MSYWFLCHVTHTGTAHLVTDLDNGLFDTTVHLSVSFSDYSIVSNQKADTYSYIDLNGNTKLDCGRLTDE